MKKNTSSNYSGIILLILILVGMPLLEPYLKSNDTSSLIMLFVIIFGLGSFLHLFGNRKSIFQIGGMDQKSKERLKELERNVNNLSNLEKNELARLKRIKSSDSDSRGLKWSIGVWGSIIVTTAIYVVFNSSPDY